jgi:hypothetical protein
MWMSDSALASKLVKTVLSASIAIVARKPLAFRSLFNPRVLAHLSPRLTPFQLAAGSTARVVYRRACHGVSFKTADQWCRSTKKEVIFHH